jgi:hypothetical protein
MLNKILVFGGLALSLILIVENIVWRAPAYLFIDTSSTAWMLSVVSTFIGAAIWFWLKSMMITDDNTDIDNYDF